jgi:signal transduction histidine kinase/CheY-like chemotaxis protein
MSLHLKLVLGQVATATLVALGGCAVILQQLIWLNRVAAWHVQEFSAALSAAVEVQAEPASDPAAPPLDAAQRHARFVQALQGHLVKRPLSRENLPERDVVLVDTAKRVLADAGGRTVGTVYDRDPNDEVSQTLADGAPRTFSERAGPKHLVVPLLDRGGEPTGAAIVQFAQVQQDLASYAGSGATTLVAALLAAVGISAAISWFLTRTISTPLDSLRAAAERFARGERPGPVRIESEDALGVLADCFNQMVERIDATHAELVTARDAAESAGRAKADFLATMSHEIRTPMNGVLGMLGLLERGRLDADQQDLVRTARHSAESLLGLLNDVLDFSKLEAGKLSFEAVPFDLERTITEVGNTLAARAEEKGIELVLRLAPGTPRHVVGDAGRLRQVLTNLAGNAVKFTTQGHVELSIACIDLARPAARFRFEVRDTGIGIAADKLARIFERFAQADSSTTRRYGGTGLGLAISQQIVELLGGRIQVESAVGAGSTFWFELTLPMHDVGAAAAAPAELAGRRVAVAARDPALRRVLAEQLGGLGTHPSAFASAAETLADLKRQDAAAWHMVLIDRQLSDMPASDLARAFRAEPAGRAAVLALLTTRSQRDDAMRLLDAGFDVVLIKPVCTAALARTLGDAWRAKQRGELVPLARSLVAASADLAGGPPPRPPRAGRALVVDDNQTNQKVAALQLESLGFDVHVAGTGHEALQRLNATPYDIVFMDVEMPGMDGYAATQGIRRAEVARSEVAGDAQRVPVVAMTARALVGDRERCLESGMDDYIAKPFGLDELERVCERWVRRPTPWNSQPAGAAEPSAGPPPCGPSPRGDSLGSAGLEWMVGTPADAAPGGETAGAARSASGENAAIDPLALERLRKLARGRDPNLFRALVQTFLDEATERVAILKQSAQNADHDKLARTAHALKGICGNFGAQTLLVRATHLEEQGRAGAVPDAVELVRHIEQSLEQVKAALASELAS